MTIQRQEWLERTAGMLSPRDASLLERASKVLEDNILLPGTPDEKLPWHPWRGITPSRETYQGIWSWDAAFHMAAVARWNPELAREQVYIFLDRQDEKGFLPDCYNNGQLNTKFGKPPVFPAACVAVDRLSPDDAFLMQVYPRFKKYEAYWRECRGGNREGLFHYSGSSDNPEHHRAEARMESGWDNAVRWDADSPADVWAVDLNCYMVTLYRALEYMARRLGVLPELARWRSMAAALTDRINQTMWDEATGAYGDIRRRDGRSTGVLSTACFLPLYVGIAPKERAECLARLAADPSKFYPAMPVVSYDHPAYESFNYGRGPTWLNAAYWALKGLKDYGHRSLAGEMREAILDTCHRDRTAIYEWYDSRTGQGMGATDFGWSAAFVIEFILDF